MLNIGHHHFHDFFDIYLYEGTYINKYKNANADVILKYKINENIIRIFGEEFVKKNKDKVKIIFKDDEIDLKKKAFVQLKKGNNNFVIGLKVMNKLTDLSYLFYNCSSLIEVKNVKFDFSGITDTTYMFGNCYSLKSIDILSFEKLSNLKNMNGMFSGCSSLTSLPDMYYWILQM